MSWVRDEYRHSRGAVELLVIARRGKLFIEGQLNCLAAFVDEKVITIGRRRSDPDAVIVV